jgi:hypothetical protein
MRSRHLKIIKDKKAASPAVSTVILTAGILVMVLVAMTFSNDLLGKKLAENEFKSNQQFMVTAGQQIDDIAWTIGRSQTVSYLAKYGFLNFTDAALEYTFHVHSTSTGWHDFTAPLTGIIMYNLPIDSYSIGDNYSMPNGSFLQTGSLAPVSQVFLAENISAKDGRYTRVVLAPTVRMLNSSLVGDGAHSNLRFYLPILTNGVTSGFGADSIRLTGENITKKTVDHVDNIVISFEPTLKMKDAGFGYSFFRFQSASINLPVTNSVVEFYFGEVSVAKGQA